MFVLFTKIGTWSGFGGLLRLTHSSVSTMGRKKKVLNLKSVLLFVVGNGDATMAPVLGFDMVGGHWAIV